jgi:hypothetical protein
MYNELRGRNVFDPDGRDPNCRPCRKCWLFKGLMGSRKERHGRVRVLCAPPLLKYLFLYRFEYFIVTIQTAKVGIFIYGKYLVAGQNIAPASPNPYLFKRLKGSRQERHGRLA